MADEDNPSQKVEKIQPVTTPVNAPEIPLPPAGAFKLAILTAIKYGGVQKAYQSYSAALEAKDRSVRALAGVHDAKGELERSIERLNDIQTIIDTDADLRAAARADAEAAKADAEYEIKISAARNERTLLEEEIQLHKVKQRHAKVLGDDSDMDDPEADEILAAFKAGLSSHVDLPQRIHEAAEDLVEERRKARGGEENFTEEDWAWVEKVRKYERDFVESTQEDDDY